MEPSFAAVLPSGGVYVNLFEGERVVADSTVGMLVNRGDIHRTSHPTTAGDCNIVLAMPDGAAEPFLTVEGRFPRRLNPISVVEHITHIRMASRLTTEPVTALEIEEWGVSVLSTLAGGHDRIAPVPRHRSLVADTREHLAVEYPAHDDLGKVARQVGSSPHHLSRVFHATMGLTLSAYRRELRVRHVLAALADGHRDLAALALEAGFYDQAHMTNTMRRLSGETPGRLRELLDAPAIPE